MKYRTHLVNENPSLPVSDIDAAMYTWFSKQREYMNPFMDVPCMSFMASHEPH